MSKYDLHPDLKKFEKITFSLSPSLLPFMNGLLSMAFDRKRPLEDALESQKWIPGFKNASIKLSIFEPKDLPKHAPCLIYFHGGAFALKPAPFHKDLLCYYAAKTPCKVVFVDYRLAPQFPFPVGLMDCYAAFEWVRQNADDLGVDINRIAVGGDSAGGALAAAVSLIARDRKTPSPCFQLLIYPVTDARQVTASMKNFVDTPIWNSGLTRQMWNLYLKNGIPGPRAYASPMEADSFKGLAPAYIEVAEFDCLRDEGVNFADALKQDGVQAELHETKGTMHGFEVSVKSEFVKQILARRVEALQKAFLINEYS